MEAEVDRFVSELLALHPSLSQVRFWRVLTTGCIRAFHAAMEGDTKTTKQTYRDVMEVLKES